MSWLTRLRDYWIGQKPVPAPEPEPVAVLLRLINTTRGSLNLRHVQRGACLDAQAAKHCRWMAANGELSHDGFDDRMTACQCVAGAENVSSYRTAKEVVTDWLRSPLHRNNMLGRDWTVCGTARVIRGDQVYWCAIFA